MTIDVDALVDSLINREGGYVNNPNDKGGETNFGITLTQARAYGYMGTMLALPRAVAATIYKDLYWSVPRFDRIEPEMPKLAAELFDTGVNMGPQAASKFLQRALNALNNNGRDYSDIDVDGNIGNMSIYALTQFQRKRGPNAEIVLLRLMESEQAVRYMEIAEKNPAQETFMYGWVLNRVGDIA